VAVGCGGLALVFFADLVGLLVPGERGRP
jgi:hypothetical protein